MGDLYKRGHLIQDMMLLFLATIVVHLLIIKQKKTSNASADLKVSTLGKAMDARAQSYSGGTGAWVRISTVGGPFKLPNKIKSGKSTRVEFSSDLTQLVDAKVKGQWRSN